MYTTKEFFLDHAKSIGKPAVDYYNKMFNDQGGDCYNIRQMVEASQIFNSLFLSGHTDVEIITKLFPLADKLLSFGYNHLTKEFIAQLKKELPRIVKEADKYHDLDTINCSKQFKTRMQKRIGRKKLDINTVLDWNPRTI